MSQPDQSRGFAQPLPWGGGGVLVKVGGPVLAASPALLAESIPSACGLRLSDFASKLLEDHEIKEAIDRVGTPDAVMSAEQRELAVNVDNARVAAVVRRLLSREGPLALLTFQIEPASLEARGALTGLPDRRALAGWASRQRRGGSPLAALFVDLDDFKRINDVHGHAAGDRVLEELARRWSECVRDDDMLIRYGGDEFVVLLEGVATAAEAAPVVDRLRAATRRRMKVGETTVQLTATIGVALSADPATPLEALVAEADRDMYARKPSRRV